MKNPDSLAMYCFNKLSSLIIQGKLKPGEKLKGEYLKKVLNAGLSPIREALSKLVSTGLVEFKDKAGFRVTILTEKKVYDIFKTYAQIECLLIRESIENADDNWEANVIAALYTLAKVERTNNSVAYNVWAPRNEEFHNILVSGCKSEMLTQIRIKCLQMKDWCINLSSQNIEQIILVDHAEHARIAELAIAKKTELCLSKLYKHLTTGVDTLIMNLNKNNILQKI